MFFFCERAEGMVRQYQGYAVEYRAPVMPANAEIKAQCSPSLRVYVCMLGIYVLIKDKGPPTLHCPVSVSADDESLPSSVVAQT